MGVLLRTVGTSAPNPVIKRAVHWLASGSAGRCISVVGDTNQTGVTGDGGDNTGVAKIYIYFSEDYGNTWILKNTLICDTWTVYSSAIDANDNIHITYRSSPTLVRYLMLTFNSGALTFTAGTVSALYSAPGSNYVHSYIDIDTVGDASGSPLAVVSLMMNNSVAGQKGSRYIVYSIRNGTTVTAGPTTQLSATDSNTSGTGGADISIAAIHSTPVASKSFFAVISTRELATTGDKGDICNIFSVSTTSGAIALVSTITIGNAGLGTGKRQYMLFSGDGSNVLTLMGFFGNNRHYFYQFSLDTTTGAKTDIITPKTNSTVTYSTVEQTVYNYFSFAKVILGTNTYYVYYGRNQYYLYIFAYAKVTSASTLTWNMMSSRVFDDKISNGTTSSLTPGAAISGGNRNFGSRPGAVIYYNRNKTWRADFKSLDLATPPIITSPSGNISDATPILSALVYVKGTYSQLRYKLKWQFASDSGFSTNLVEYLQDDSKLTAIDSVRGGQITSTDQLPSNLSLSQGTTFIRAALIDELGNLGPYSAASSVTITHPPTAVNVTPNSDTAVIYGTGVINIGWKFTDPWSEDHQTAYQILITATGDGSTVYDTGKVSSGATIGTVSIPVGYKDNELSATVTLWDSGDVSGQASDPALFFVSDAPAPVISSPLGTITTTIPSVNWDPGLSSVKVQTKFRVLITQGRATIMDSGWQIGADTSYPVPAGLPIKNLNSYTFTVQVEDSIGFRGTVSTIIATNWAVPLIANPQMFSYELDRKGFLHIGWDATTIDSDFFAWNLYRRKPTDDGWTLLETIVDTLPVYGYQDYEVGTNTRYLYAVTQVVNRFGDIIESLIPQGLLFTPLGQFFWLIDSLGAYPAIPLFNATADSYTREHEEAVYTVLGAGRHVDQGELLGVNGTLAISLRNSFIGVPYGNNFFLNSAMQMTDDGVSPRQWTLGTTGANIFSKYETYIEPAPCGKAQVLRIGADLSAGNQITIKSAQAFITGTDMDVTDTFFASAWFATPPQQTMTYTVTGKYTFYAPNGTTVVGTANSAFAVTAATTDSESRNYTAFGNWKRYSGSVTIPVAAVYVSVEFDLTNTSGVYVDNATFYCGGFSLGGYQLPYFDGDYFGCEYLGPDANSGSTSYGYYRAREQRQDIEEIRGLNRPLKMRNPFGDIWEVSLGDIAVTHTAGTGTDEISDITIPYREVGF